MAQDGRRLCLLDGFVATSRARRMFTVTRLFMALVTACAVSLFAHGRSCADTRVALVIGNGAYSHEPVLKNPPNDAHDMAAALRELGFQVTEAIDADKATLDARLREYLDAAEGADIALLFYAGHGMQLDGRNLILPIDAKLERRSSIDYEAVDVDRIIGEMESAAKTVLIFLDACRDNPLAGKFAAVSGRSAGASRGLAPPELTTSAGVLISFSTAPGKVAADGDARNSPFTTALLRHIRTPGVEIKSVMTRVRADVAAATGDVQVPWDSNSLRTEIFLAPAQSASTPPSAAPAPDEPCLRLVAPDAEPDEILKRDVDAGLRACAEGVGDHPDDARFAARLHVAKEQRAFRIAMTSSSSDAAEAYLVLYPSGRFTTRVRERLATLETRPPPSTPQIQPFRVPPAPSSAPLEAQSLDTKTRALISRYFAISNKQTEDGTGLGPLYASSVSFYGKEMPRNEIVRQKVAYFRDWSLRSYKVKAHDVSCLAELCSSTGTVGWALTSESRRVVASGKSTFSFTVDWSDGSGKITSESGAVVSHEAHKM
jgi:Caspase domain